MVDSNRIEIDNLADKHIYMTITEWQESNIMLAY